MALDGKTWREHPFVVGKEYEVLSSFQGYGGHFIAGHLYRLRHIGHSHYDDCTIFTFTDSSKGETIAWWWHDEEPVALCAERFRAWN